MHIYIYRERERDTCVYIYVTYIIHVYPFILDSLGKGTNGVSTNGVTATFMFFDGGTFGVALLT